jgi:septum formation protein
MTMPELILASTSRYRAALLGRLGMPFRVAAPLTDETPLTGEMPNALALRLSLLKARSVAAPDALVIGSDQVAALGRQTLGKPGDHATALKQLMACQGRTVTFYTAVTVLETRSQRSWQGLDRTRVHFADLDAAAIDQYLRRERPYDCAGGFKAEGLGIALFTRIESDDPTGLLGLPLIWLCRTLRQAGFEPLTIVHPEQSQTLETAR